MISLEPWAYEKKHMEQFFLCKSSGLSLTDAALSRYNNQCIL